MGTCPKCENLVSTARLEAVTIDGGGGNCWRGVSYVCPSCSCVLGIGIDPVALKAELLDDLKDLFSR
jgi:hypothetical protein